VNVAHEDYWQDKQAGAVVPALSEQWKDGHVMEFSMNGVGSKSAQQTVLVDAATDLSGMDLGRYRNAVRAARGRAMQAGIGPGAGDIAGGGAPESGMNGN
jgi:hypothetical protein